jgi:hypothetical protein
MIREENNLQCFDGVSSQSYMVRKEPSIHIKDDTSSQGSYMVRGGQDDMSSQGSYMIRRGTDFNQS